MRLVGRRRDDRARRTSAGGAAARRIPRPPHRPEPAASIPPTTDPARLVDRHVRMTWDLAGTEEHHFDAPVQIDLNDSTNGRHPSPSPAARGRRRSGTPGRLAGRHWRTGNVVHILTRHLSLFAILTGVVSDANPQRDFAAVIADDGLTLRGTGIPQVRNFVLCRRHRDRAVRRRAVRDQARPDHGRRPAPLHADGDQPARDRERPHAGAARGAAAGRPVAGGRAPGARGTRLHVGRVVQVVGARHPGRHGRRPDRRARAGRGHLRRPPGRVGDRPQPVRAADRDRAHRPPLEPLARRSRVDHRSRARRRDARREAVPAHAALALLPRQGGRRRS